MKPLRICSLTVRTCAAAAAVAVLAACGSSDELDTDPTPAESSETSEETTEAGVQISGDGYSYAVPQGWEDAIDEPLAEGADTFVRAPEPVDEFVTNMNTVVSAAPGVEELQLDSPELEQVREQLATSAEGQTGVRPQPIEDAELDGSPAIGHRVDSFEAEGRTLTLTQYLTVRDEVSYVITVTASATDAEQADDAVRTVLGSWAWE
jgi:hypothetical protein